jgi:hypothetical protein
MNANRKRILALMTAAGLALANLWCYVILVQSKDAAQTAVQSARQSEQSAARIIALQAKPTVAGTREEAVNRLASRFEAAARALGIAGDNIASIVPDQPARIADSAYLEQATTVQLRQVTLVQLVDLLCGLADDDSGLRIKALRLSTPLQQKTGDGWSAELTATYLIYSPLPTNSSDRSNS